MMKAIKLEEKVMDDNFRLQTQSFRKTHQFLDMKAETDDMDLSDII